MDPPFMQHNVHTVDNEQLTSDEEVNEQHTEFPQSLITYQLVDKCSHCVVEGDGAGGEGGGVGGGPEELHFPPAGDPQKNGSIFLMELVGSVDCVRTYSS